MIPNTKHRELQSRGVQEQGNFGISKQDEGHLMTILRDTLYSDKVLAVLREYSSNAWDAHREAGKPTLPIKITMPTDMEPTLSIRDWGLGLSPVDVFEVFTQYGASTKRDNDNAVGMLGIGCLLKGQPIVTVMGMKPIEEVKVGDLVLTHRNRYRRVTELMRRPHKGPAYKVWLSQTTDPLILTANHPILVSDHLGNTRWSKPGDIKTGYRSKKKGIEAWNTYATLPATIESTVQHLHTLAFLGSEYSFENGVCHKRTAHATRWVNKKATRTTSWPSFPERLSLDEELGWLLGLYAAEGSASTKQVVISLNITEKDIAARFTHGMRKYFGVDFKWYERPAKTLLELVAHHTPLAHLLSQLCGSGAKYKSVPWPVMMGPDEVRRGFLRGVFDGDGSSTRSRFVFGVASPTLAWGVRTLMATTEDKWGTVGTMEEYSRWSIHYDRESAWSYSHRKGDYLLRPIVKTEEFELEAEVFNFSVEDDESYVSDFILHNSKSGFAYSDSFTIISWHNGMKSMYVAVLDKSEKGVINLLHSESCGDETGIEIQIAIRSEDIQEFVRTARKLFRHYEPRPDINIELPPIPGIEASLTHGMIYQRHERGNGWVAVMGCVPYHINLDQLRDFENGIPRYLKDLSGALRFGIGEVHINASREELKYSTPTKRALVEKFNLLTEEFVGQMVRTIEAKDLNLWQKRMQYRELGDMNLPVPEEYKNLSEGFVKLDPAPASFFLTHGVKATATCNGISIKEDSRVVLRDTHKPIVGYGLLGSDFVVRRVKNSPWSTINDELTAALEKAGLTGIPILKLSELEWSPPTRTSSGKTINPKHMVRSFRLVSDHRRYSSPWSACWAVEERTPTDEDVYVVIKAFKTEGWHFFDSYRTVAVVAQAFSEVMPPIYGYKTTEHKPVVVEDLVGTEFRAWRAGFLKKLLARPEVAAHLEHKRYLAHFDTSYYRYHRLDLRTRMKVTADLGLDHPIVQFINKACESRKYFDNLCNSTLGTALDLLTTETPKDDLPSPAYLAYDALKKMYPLLLLPDTGLHSLWDDHSNSWIEYVHLIDNTRRRQEHDQHSRLHPHA